MARGWLTGYGISTLQSYQGKMKRREKNEEKTTVVDDAMMVCWPLPRKLIVAFKIGFACLQDYVPKSVSMIPEM